MLLNGTMNWTDVEENSRDFIYGTIPAFNSRSWGKP